MISSASGWRRRKIHRFHVFRRFRRPHRWPVKTTQPNSVVETSGNSSDFSGSNRPSNSLTSQTTKHSSSQHFGKTFSRQIRSMNQNISQLQFMAEYLNIYFTHTHTHTEGERKRENDDDRVPSTKLNWQFDDTEALEQFVKAKEK